MYSILLVEPVEIVRHVLAARLARSRFNVLQVSSGSAALKIFEAYAPDIHLLITEVVLDQEMNGVDLSFHLTTKRPEIRLLYLSAKPPIVRSELFLTKPFGIEEFMTRVGKLLDRRTGERRSRGIVEAGARDERRQTDRRGAGELSRFTLNPLTGAAQSTGVLLSKSEETPTTSDTSDPQSTS